MKLRPYQEECIQEIEKKGNGRWICSLATGLGKTVIFTNLKRKGKTLILAHKRELITQPAKYFDCKIGVEMAEQTSNGEEVIIARHHHPLVKIVPLASEYKTRKIGSARGMVRMSDDFDSIPEGFEEYI